MLTSEKRAEIADAALTIQVAASHVRDLVADEPVGLPPSTRYLGLSDLIRDLEDARRRLLELWS